MGISNSTTGLLLAARATGHKFGNAATLGKQYFWPSAKVLKAMLPAFGLDWKAADVLRDVATDGSKFLKMLGAEKVTEFDASAYEGASAVHDMNTPLPDRWKGQFDFLYDGGSMEHIFDVRQVVENITNLVKVGGVFVGATAGNNQSGHGFYQFSPELFYRIFCRENGWDTTCILFCEHQADPPRFWSVTDPKKLRHRIELQNEEQLYLMIITKKIANVEKFITPQQSDYSAAWIEPDQAKRGPRSKDTVPVRLRRKITRHLREIFPSESGSGPVIKRAEGLKQEGIRQLSYQNMRDASY